MGILSKNGNKLNRATGIIAEINKTKQDPEGQEGQEGQEGTPQGQEGQPQGQEGQTQGQEGQPQGQEDEGGQEGEPQGQEGQPQGQEGQEGQPQGQEGQEGQPQDTVEPKPALAEIGDDVILAKLSETLGRKIESYDDLKPKEIAVDPELKQLIEWKEKTGLSLTQFADYTRDYSQMSDMEVAREILKQKYPTFTREQLDFELSSLVYDESMDDETDKMRKSVELTKLATEGRQMLESKKLELKPIESKGLTQEQQEAIEFANNVKQQNAQIVENQTAYENNLNLAAQNLDTVALNLDEGVVINHKVDDGDKNSLKDFILNPPHWFDEKGNPIPANIAQDGYKIKNFDALIKAAFEQGKAVQKEADIKGKGNVNLDTTPAPQGQSQETKSNISQVISHLTSNNSQRRGRFRKKS